MGSHGDHFLISAMTAGRRDKQAALALVAFSSVAFFATLPYVRVTLAALPAFIPTYEAALMINDLITAVLLFGQFATMRSRAMLFLASGYLFDALIMIPHALSFPGAFSSTGLLGAGSQTTAWLYVFWHGGFAVFALAYAIARKRDAGDREIAWSPRAATIAASLGVAALALLLTVWSTLGHDLLPVIINGTDFSLLVTKGVSPAVWVLSLAALLTLLSRRKPSVLDLWVMVVLCAWLFDVALSAMINSNRFDLGFYAGRSYGLLASGFVLVVLLIETNGLHRRLATVNADLEERVAERTAALAQSNDSLKREIAERKQAEAQLIQSQKMEAIGNLTGGMAHDFNNMLGIIIGNLDLLRGSPKFGLGTNDMLRDAIDAAVHGSELTRRLLAFARRQPLQPQPIDVNALVADTAKLLTRTLGEQVQISLELGRDLAPAIADPAQLEAAIVNLANNARDAMPGGGHLTIATVNSELDQDYAAQHSEVAPGDYVAIRVSDTGSGMPPAVMARIFEPFFTTKEVGKGTGLGLSMVFGFTKQSGGHITVYSEPGIGTTFSLYLPPAEAETAATRTPVIEDVPLGRGQTVLVVEDNASLRRLVTQQLTELGYEVIAADNGALALDILKRKDVDLLFTDIVMPGKINGIELARMASERWPDLPAVLTSGFPNNANVLVAPSVRMLLKPYRREELARALWDELKLRPLRRRLSA
ncbi:MAG TPA: MASE4 domain-containing protein [Stellaceae bacterium]|jgi:signal transduction histidine kinase